MFATTKVHYTKNNHPWIPPLKSGSPEESSVTIEQKSFSKHKKEDQCSTPPMHVAHSILTDSQSIQ